MASSNLRYPNALDFSNSQEQWPEWISRFERFRLASGLDEKSAERQVNTLVYTMGEEAEKVYSQLTITKPTETEATENPQLLYERTVKAFKDYFNPTSNSLHYSILLSSCVQKMGQTNEEFIRELYELAGKCDFSDEQNKSMIKMRLLAGMSDKPLSRELQLDPAVTVDAIKTRMRAKETILNNQKKEIDGEKLVGAVVNHPWSGGSCGPTTQKSLGRGRGEEEGTDRRALQRFGSGAEPRQQFSADFIKDCRFCGKSHARRRCPAYGKRCAVCKQFNHFAKSKMCSVKKAHEIVSDGTLQQVSNAQAESEFLNLDALHVCNNTKVFTISSKWLVDVRMNNQSFKAKVDTGADVSVMCKCEAKGLGVQRVRKSAATIIGYTGKAVPVLGSVELEISVCHDGVSRSCKEEFFIVEQKADTLLGMPAIKALRLIPSIAQVSTNQGSSSCDAIVNQYKHVFEGLGKYHTPISLQLKQGAEPRAAPPRLVPEKVRSKLKLELERLEQEGIIARDAEPSEWLSPPIIVNKPDGSIRLCLDPQYLNSQLVRTQCSLSTPSEIFSRISGSKFFSCLDGKQGFHQLVLDSKSSHLTCFVTPFGKYKYLRLPMGITNAPELFHQLMVDTLQGIPGVECYIDDVLIHAATLEEHNNRLSAVLERFSQAGITLNRTKSVFGQNEVLFLGHELTGNGVRPHPAKVDTIREMMVPQDKKAVQSFLGFVGYLSKFINNLADLTYPLRQLCKKKAQFIWEKPQQVAFDKLKDAIASSSTLAYFDPNKPVTLATDSSAHSVGAVLLQDNRPVEFAAKSLTETQQRYSVIEKEFLAIAFACKRFRYYLWGRDAIAIETDHQPLIGLMHKPINELSPRLAQMRLEMLSYPVELVLRYKPGKDMILADVLSRTCPPGTCEYDDLGVDPLLQVCQLMIRSEDAMQKYQKATREDQILSVVLTYIREGWPKDKKSCAGFAMPYFSLRGSLSEVNGIVMYGARVVIPTSLRLKVLESLHAAHQGLTKTLQRAQNSVFWPGLRKHVEDKCSSCDICLRSEGACRREPLIPFPVPEYPFQVVGTDVFHVGGENFLMVVDYLSKWPGVRALRQGMSTSVIIRVLREVFSELGTPEKIVSDNGSNFASSEFARFCSKLEIKHETSSPLHSSGNGQVERTIGTVKSMMKKCISQGDHWEDGLLAIRNTPVGVGLLAPAQYLQGRLLRDSMPLPVDRYRVKAYDIQSYRGSLERVKSRDKYYHDSRARPEKVPMSTGQACYFRTAQNSWIPGRVLRKLNDRSYVIRRSDGSEFRRNRVDIRISNRIESEVSDEVSAAPALPQATEEEEVGGNISNVLDRNAGNVEDTHDGIQQALAPRRNPQRGCRVPAESGFYRE